MLLTHHLKATLTFFFHLLPSSSSSQDSSNLFVSSLTASRRIFLGHPFCLISSFYNIQSNQHHFFHYTYLNYLSLPFFITKLTGSKPNSSLSSALFCLSFKVNHLIVLISVLSDDCSHMSVYFAFQFDQKS